MLVFALFGAAAAIQYSGPSPKRSSAPLEEVSAERAMEMLAQLLGELEQPHPVGTPENENVRIRLIGILDELGLEVTQWPTETSEGRLVSVVAHRPGKPAARPILLTTHYDSCPAGPGAGDAGQCVAALLEVARALRHRPPEHELWFVFTDGEEQGLWGAQFLVTNPLAPWGTSKPFVVNFDARGDRDAVLLYETHRDNLAAMQLAAAEIAKPSVTTSLMVNIYQLLPNATDYTVFQQVGWPGLNFAVIGGAQRYHTPNDTIANVSPRSVQHFANHALSLIRALDKMPDGELEAIDLSEPAVFFDLVGFLVIVYPAAWNWWLVLAATSLAVVAIWRATKLDSTRLAQVAIILGFLTLHIVLIAATGFLLSWVLRLSELVPRKYVDGGELITLGYLVLAAVWVSQVGHWVARRQSQTEVLATVSLGATLLAALTSFFLPGGAYLCYVPAIWLAACSLVGQCGAARAIFACLVPALLFSPTFVLLARALGPTAGLMICGATAAMLIPTLAALADGKPAIARSVAC